MYCEIDLLAPDGGFGVAQPPRHRPGEQRNQEYDATQDARGGIIRDAGRAGDVTADLLRQQGQRGHGRQ